MPYHSLPYPAGISTDYQIAILAYQEGLDYTTQAEIRDEAIAIFEEQARIDIQLAEQDNDLQDLIDYTSYSVSTYISSQENIENNSIASSSIATTQELTLSESSRTSNQEQLTTPIPTTIEVPEQASNPERHLSQ